MTRGRGGVCLPCSESAFPGDDLLRARARVGALLVWECSRQQLLSVLSLIILTVCVTGTVSGQQEFTSRVARAGKFVLHVILPS